MEKIFLVSWIWFLLLISSAQAGGLDNYHWRPMSEITAQNLAVVEGASRQRAEDVLKEARFFTVANNTVIVLDDKGVIKFFACASILTDAKKLAVSLYDQENEKLAVANSNKTPNKYLHLWKGDDFSKIWFSRENPDYLSLQDLAVADQIIQSEDFLSDISTDDFLMVARRGNRYLKTIWPFLNKYGPDLTRSFFQEYIKNDYARTEDRPSQENIVSALQIIAGTVQRFRDYTFLSENIIEKIKSLAPEAYQEMRKRIIEEK